MRFLRLRAYWLLFRYHRYLRGNDFAGLHARIGEEAVSHSSPIAIDAKQICDAVAHACIWYVRPVLCLQRSAVATVMLRRCSFPAELVIGAQRFPLRSHAWVEIGGRVVNDRQQVQTDYLVMERC